MFYRVCEHCGSALDPGERCDCQSKAAQRERYFESVLQVGADGQYKLGDDFCEKEKIYNERRAYS